MYIKQLNIEMDDLLKFGFITMIIFMIVGLLVSGHNQLIGEGIATMGFIIMVCCFIVKLKKLKSLNSISTYVVAGYEDKVENEINNHCATSWAIGSLAGISAVFFFSHFFNIKSSAVLSLLIMAILNSSMRKIK